MTDTEDTASEIQEKEKLFDKFITMLKKDTHLYNKLIKIVSIY